MRYNQLLEGKNQPCIVVDVQPAYTGVKNIFGTTMLPFVPKMMQFLNHQSRILMFVNAEDTELTEDRIIDIKDNWETAGFAPSNWNKVTTVDKGYGYLRSWMDIGAEQSSIIATVREMYHQRVTWSDELFGGRYSTDYYARMEELTDVSFDTDLANDPIQVNWTSIAQLKRYSGGYIMGGARNECLKEIELLMSAFNIKAKRIEEFVYG